MATEFWLFVLSVIYHGQSLLTGGVLALGIMIYERKKGKNISWRALLALMVAALFMSCFLAWHDEHHNAEVLVSEKSDLTSEKNVLQAKVQAKGDEIDHLRDELSNRLLRLPARISPVMIDPRSTAKLLAEFQKQQQQGMSQSPLKKELFDLSKLLIRFAMEREKVQPLPPKRPPGIYGPPPRWRNTSEGKKYLVEQQKYQTDHNNFIMQSREHFTNKFESRLASVFSQLGDQEIDVDGVPSMCSAPSADNPRTVQECGARLLVFINEVE